MIANLGTVRLKSDEDAEIYKVICPQPDWKTRLLRRLLHKGDIWQKPMNLALESGLEGLTMNFFVLELDEEIVGNITTVEALEQPIALLQHVFTDPEHRRKGVCSHLMTAVCEDFQERDGRAMYLGTGYDTPPFWIYHDYGFRPIGQTGSMIWKADPDFPEGYFVEGDVSVRWTLWGDWPLLNVLYQLQQGWSLRGYIYGQFGHDSYEGTFCKLQRDLDADDATESAVLHINETGAIVGHALVARDKKWPAGPWVLDFFVHPDYISHAPELLDCIDIPSGPKVQCYADAGAADRLQLIEDLGFEREAELCNQYDDRDGQRRDVVVFRRSE